MKTFLPAAYTFSVMDATLTGAAPAILLAGMARMRSFRNSRVQLKGCRSNIMTSSGQKLMNATLINCPSGFYVPYLQL